MTSQQYSMWEENCAKILTSNDKVNVLVVMGLNMPHTLIMWLQDMWLIGVLSVRIQPEV